MPDHTPSARAVFLSYAREDAEPAKRIAEALRGFGVEVWFDMSELRGGDQWDQKIRGQIKACGLFIPVISATTQARDEAYFRLEWKLADDRSHLMASGKAFIVPVVIDDTPEAGAAVPESFGRAQWTRLPAGAPTPQFVEQVKRLLSGEKDGGRGLRTPPAPTQTGNPAGFGDPAPQKKKAIPGWTWGALTAVVVGVAVALGVGRKPEPAALPEPKPQTPEPVRPPSVADKSVAVLPFTNMSEEKDSAFFTDGMHEDILTNLALIRELRVVSRTSVMAYRATTKPMRQIAQELGVTYILEGSVRRSGNKVRVTGQLIHAATDEHVWAQSFDRDITDVFAIQAELSSQIAGALKAALSPEEKALLARKPTENPAAYDFFLRSRDISNREGATAAARKKRIALLQSAVDLDPAFAQGWGELASACAFAYFGNLVGSEEYLARAKAAIERAVQLAPEDPEVISSLGTYHYYGYRDYDRATEQYLKLARLQPNAPTVFNSLGLIQRRQGRWAESLANTRRACELDPANIGYLRNLLATYQSGRRWPDVIATQRRIVALLPDNLTEGYMLAQSHFWATGSRRETEAFFAALTPDQLNSPEGIELRSNWAKLTSNTAEIFRLDRLQPFYDANGSPHVEQAVYAALYYFQAGDRAGALARLAEHPAELRRLLEAEPRNGRLLITLAAAELILGRPEETRRLADQCVALMPESRDASDGPRWALQRAFLYGLTGDQEVALAELTRLARLPGTMSLERLKLEQTYVSPALRQDPRFQAFLADPKNYAPLF
ncbi:Tetratricopeptide repeat protein [Lacunisphaera limnophila]|uniref:Tetratricopeptide repeat protein n=1 Tax=Lacunisphaera limnophila TaxID=1838286 RepID=A0A1D8ARZ1_9BACT|nr:TIR domain-containing protein [Lacunisphaera limnophila]AOS43664.1 Tetratricopeptide repeat protein [Lacunisphaera limnophila]